MALIEVEEGEIQKLRAERDTNLAHKVLLDKLGTNPKTRRQVLSLIKEINPDVQIPEIDATKPLEEKIAALEKVITDDKTARAKEEADKKTAIEKERAEQFFADGHKYLRKNGFNDDGVKEFEKFMTEKGLMNYEDAMTLWDRDHPKEASVIPADFGRDMGLFSPPEDNPWAQAVRLPKGAGQERALRNAQNKEINKWAQENGLKRRA